MKLASLLCAAAIALAAPRSKKGPSYAEQGETAFDDGDVQAAAEAFELAYAEDPQPDYLFAWAQAERFLGRCERAVELYDALLQETVGSDEFTEKQRAKAVEARDECAVTLEADRPPPPPPSVPQPESVDQLERPSRRWYQDPLGGALVGVGSAILITGAIVRGTAVARSENARIAATEGAFESDHADSRKLGTVGVVAIGVGAAVLVTGVVRWVLLARRSSPQ